MSCENCEQFDIQVPIQSPQQLIRIGQKVRQAVEAAQLRYNSFESDRELVGQPSFTSLDFEIPLPDIIRYHFDCPTCGSCFGLFVETYHGSGGSWACLKN